MSGKAWGPFTGAQLTMIILGGMATLAVPGSLWAVATSAVSITDPANGHTAAVSVGRRLFVTALMEGIPTPAAYLHTHFVSVGGARGCQALVAPPTGRAAIVTAVRIDVFENPTPGGGNHVIVHSGTTCGTTIADVNPPTVGHYVVPFEPGFATQAGISVDTGGGVQAEAFADGYFVPASQVPAAPATTASVVSPQAQYQQ